MKKNSKKISKRTSTIFTDHQISEIERREKGEYDDKTGIYSRVIKPKLIEILEEWIPQKNRILKIIKSRK